MKKVIVTVLTLIICQAGIAQSERMNERIEKKVQELDQLLDLSEEQEVAIETVLLETASKAKELKSTSSSTKEEIKALRQSSSERIKEELTPDQLELLAQHKKEKNAERRTQGQEIKEHRKNALRPALRAERGEFENILSQEEKDVIQHAREMVREFRSDSNTKEERRANKAEIKELLDPIITKHQSDLEQVQLRLQPIMDEHKALRQEHRVRKNRNDLAPPAKEGDGRFEVRFLLMEP